MWVFGVQIGKGTSVGMSRRGQMNDFVAVDRHGLAVDAGSGAALMLKCCGVLGLICEI